MKNALFTGAIIVFFVGKYKPLPFYPAVISKIDIKSGKVNNIVETSPNLKDFMRNKGKKRIFSTIGEHFLHWR